MVLSERKILLHKTFCCTVLPNRQPLSKRAVPKECHVTDNAPSEDILSTALSKT